MGIELKTLEDFVKLHSVKAGYKVIDKREVDSLYKLLSKFSHRQKSKQIEEKSLFLSKGTEKINVILYSGGFDNITPDDIKEQEKKNASNGIYTAHIFQKDGLYFGIERYTSNPIKEKNEGKPIILRPLEREVALLKPHIIAYFLPKQGILDLFMTEIQHGGIGHAYKIQTISSGSLYFPHDEETKMAVPYFKPEIEVSEVRKLIPKQSTYYGNQPTSSKIILPGSFKP